MTNQVALLGEAGPAPPPHARGPAPQVSAAGVTDAAALARQQLPSAVPAASLVAAYHTASVPPPPKPLPRVALAQPSSALAAQLLAQDQLTTEADRALFTPRATTLPGTPPPAEDPYLQDLRIARGEVAAPTAPQKAAAQNTLAQAPESALRASVIQATSALPLAAGGAILRGVLGHTRGPAAYQKTSERKLTPFQAEAM